MYIYLVLIRISNSTCAIHASAACTAQVKLKILIGFCLAIIYAFCYEIEQIFQIWNLFCFVHICKLRIHSIWGHLGLRYSAMSICLHFGRGLTFWLIHFYFMRDMRGCFLSISSSFVFEIVWRNRMCSY